VRWIIAFAITLLPFNGPTEIHATEVSKSVNDNQTVCVPTLGTNNPGLVCDQQKIQFKIADSENEIKIKKEKERLAKLARAVQTVGASTDVTKLYPEAGQCVPFARAITGIQISGAAISNKPNTSTPHAGDIIITKESSVGHAAAIKAINGNKLVLLERNYFSGFVSTRVIPINFSKIVGFITKNS
jgi:hypothetical protein